MCDQDLPTSLFTEATNIVVYIHNRNLHAILGDKTLEEAFTGEKPEVGNLKIFGFLVYIHVTNERRMKMEPSRVSYSETSKAYRIYVLGQR